VRGGRGNRWLRPLLAGLIALALLLLALYALDRAGGYVRSSDVLGAACVSALVAAIVGAIDS
jgi:hypothetical protein